MDNEVKYVLICWKDDLEEDSFLIFLAKSIMENNGIVCPFIRPEAQYGDKYYARADYRALYPDAKIIDVM